MSDRRDLDYLRDMQEAIQRIIEYTNDLSFEHFELDRKTQDAVVRNLEIIGEATKRLSPQLRKTHAQISWKNIAGLRDKLIHHYFGIDYETVWTIIQDELPDLLIQIESLLASSQGR